MFKGMIDRLKLEVFIAGAISSQVGVWVGYLTAWGKLDGLFPPASQSIIATAVTGFLATVISALGMVLLVRVYRLLNYLGRLAEDAESEIRGVVLEPKAAKEFESPKIVGPKDAGTL